MLPSKLRNIGLNLTLVIVTLITLLLSLSLYSHLVVFPYTDPSLEHEGDTKQEVIKVAILNACGQSGLASKTQKFLRNLGFDVVEIGNTNEKLSSSVVIDRLGDKKSAFKVAMALGIRDSLIYTHVDSSLYLRATVIIGKDFKELKPFK